jgi:hypothetical protein
VYFVHFLQELSIQACICVWTGEKDLKCYFQSRSQQTTGEMRLLAVSLSVLPITGLKNRRKDEICFLLKFVDIFQIWKSLTGSLWEYLREFCGERMSMWCSASKQPISWGQAPDTMPVKSSDLR